MTAEKRGNAGIQRRDEEVSKEERGGGGRKSPLDTVFSRLKQRPT